MEQTLNVDFSRKKLHSCDLRNLNIDLSDQTKNILKTRAKCQNQDSDDVKAGSEILDLQIMMGCFFFTKSELH